MYYPSIESVEVILAQIASGVPRDSIADQDLPKLVLAGLCMRYHMPTQRIVALFPGSDLSWIQGRLIETMDNPTLSQWYFSNLERFDSRFRRMMNHNPVRYGRSMSIESAARPTVAAGVPLWIPAMPVSCGSNLLSSTFVPEVRGECLLTGNLS